MVAPGIEVLVTHDVHLALDGLCIVTVPHTGTPVVPGAIQQPLCVPTVAKIQSPPLSLQWVFPTAVIGFRPASESAPSAKHRAAVRQVPDACFRDRSRYCSTAAERIPRRFALAPPDGGTTATLARSRGPGIPLCLKTGRGPDAPACRYLAQAAGSARNVPGGVLPPSLSAASAYLPDSEN